MAERTPQELADFALVAFALRHTGHDGIPGARDDSCPRCNSERALTELVRRAEEAERHDHFLIAQKADQRARAAEQERDRLRVLLREAVGWMEGVDPKPAPPFLAECRAALDASREAG